MRRSTGPALALLAALAGPAAAQQVRPDQIEKAVTAPAGQETVLTVLANVNTACNGLPVPEVHLARPPRQGTLILRVAGVKVRPDAARCAGRELPALSVLYRPAEAPRTEADTVCLDVVAGGSRQAQTYTIRP